MKRIVVGIGLLVLALTAPGCFIERGSGGNARHNDRGWDREHGESGNWSRDHDWNRDRDRARERMSDFEDESQDMREHG